jgi:CheY-like chemotaxis protein
VKVRVAGDDHVCTVTVADTGTGIPAEFLPHVFERFRQADGSTTREHGGLGLGLAIVKEITELHGGQVQAASDGNGHGATFTVTLPRAAGAAPAVLVTGMASIVPPPRLDSVDVLAVDDNPDALDIIAPALRDAGARVRLAASGAEALDQVRRAPPDVVLCDIGMPQMDGFELLRRIRAIDRETGRSTPVLAVSAYASDEYRLRSLAAGFQGHVAKPFNAFDLVQVVADVLSRAS